MNRRDFIRQAAAAAAGIALGAKLPVALESVVEPELKAMPLSRYASLLGIDVARPGSEDFSAVAWHSKTGEVYCLESFVIDRPPFDYYHLVREWNLSLAEVAALPVEDKALMGTYSYYRSILEETEKQTPWAKVMEDAMEQGLDQLGGSFDEIPELPGFDRSAFKGFLEKLLSTDEAKAATEGYGIQWGI